MKQELVDILLSNKELNFKNLFSICVGKIYSNNIEFEEKIKGYSNWDTDITTGELILGENKFKVDYIGSTTESDKMWYSAELEKSIPDEYVGLTIEARKRMEDFGFTKYLPIKVFVDDRITGEMLSIMNIAFLEEKKVCFFVGKAAEIELFMFIKADGNEQLLEEVTKKIPSYKFVPRVLEIIERFDVNAKLMVKSFLINNNCEFFETRNNSIIAVFDDDNEVKFCFNEVDALTKIEGYLD